ncbi:MAG TPA: serine/threonine-protein kinase, partial [Thermoanaerobaculia bacterium]
MIAEEDRWDRMWGLFHEALDRPAGERGDFLAAACAGDPELRREVEELLASHEEAESGGGPALLATRSPGAPGAAAWPPPAEGGPLGEGGRIGQRLGAYRLLRELGSGGMGVVYLAERADGELHRRVAIKVLPRGMETGESLRRFRQERQILARLDHPNIARLIDAGTTEDGCPYFVMEHVEGEPIDLYCRRLGLPLEARLGLVQTVCAAVHAAHQHLIVHRDLKPGNLLVTGDGVPKLLDFGIAKLLDPAAAGGPSPETRGAWRPMTPEYASPEQIRGEAVTTGSDVYALGVLLYELLTGVHPFRAATSSPHEVVRRVCDTEPERPSTAVLRGGGEDGAGRGGPDGAEGSPERLARRLRGDLDTIVLTAMHKDPARRYGSAEQLAQDLERHLAGLPVAARRDTLRYRAGKFVRRHRWGVAAAALFVLLLAGFGAAMALQSVRLERERAQAERERERAERVSGFLVELFRISYPSKSKGETITARELLDRGAAQLGAGLEDEPEVLARLLRTVGKVYESLGLYDEAAPLLERSLDQHRRLYGETHPEVATGLSDIAVLATMRGEYERARDFYERAIAMRRELLGEEAPEVAESLNALAVMLHEAGDYERAEEVYGEVMALQRRAHGEESWQVSQVAGNLGWLLHDRGRFDEAEPLYRRALDLNRKLLGEEHRWVAASLNNLGLLHHDRGDLDAAERYYLRAWALDRKLLGDEPHPALAGHLHNQARLWHDRGDLDRAEALYERALAIRRQALPPDHPAIATSLAGVGRLLTDRGEAEAAEPLLRQALEIRRAGLAPANWHIAEAESLLGACL